MKKKLSAIRNLVLILPALALVCGGPGYGEEGRASASYLHTLSNFSGVLPVSWAKLNVDESRDEIYVVTSSKVKVFNKDGMEVYSFNESMELGRVLDVAVDAETGDIIALAQSWGGEISIIRCDFRGDPVATLALKDLPAGFSGFAPNRIIARGGLLYLASTSEMKVAVTDREGVFRKGHDIAALLAGQLEAEQASEREKEREKQDQGITGFTVDRDGNILFTNGVMARVFKLSRDGQIRSFGVRGSTAGKFGVPGDVAADATGNYILVADTLRCVVLVFDSNTFQFQSEFGTWGRKPANLVGPLYMAVDSSNRVYVSQLRNRGVNVYQFSGS